MISKSKKVYHIHNSDIFCTISARKCSKRLRTNGLRLGKMTEPWGLMIKRSAFPESDGFNAMLMAIAQEKKAAAESNTRSTKRMLRLIR